MKIHLIHQYYKTPEEGGGIRSWYLARHLEALGHEVKVITAYNGKEYTVKRTNNVEVHYLPIYYSNHLSFSSRLHAFYRYIHQTQKLIKKLGLADLNYVISTPLFTGIIAMHARRKYGTPYIFEVGDLWPEAPIQLKVIRNPILKHIAYRLESRIYHNAKTLVALSPGIAEGIHKVAPEKSVEIITNMADTGFFKPKEKSSVLLQKYGVTGKFVVAYTGTVGLANQLEYLLGAAEACLNMENIHFIVAGSGARWEAIKIIAGEKGLNNIDFIEFIDKEGVREILSISDAVYISFKDIPVLSTGSPNKFFDGLAAGKLIIINFKGWIKNLVEDNKCGFHYPPSNPASFQEQLMPYIQDHDLLKKAKENARKLAESNFSTEKQMGRLASIIEK